MEVLNDREISIAEPNWASSRTLGMRNRLHQLHEEIIDFYHFIKPNASERQAHKNIVDRLSQITSEVWPDSSLELFGSVKTGLWVPNSDIDVVLVARGTSNAILQKLHKEIKKADLASHLEKVFSATVPILKMRDKKSGIYLDISCNTNNGLTAIDLVKSYIYRYPE